MQTIIVERHLLKHPRFISFKARKPEARLLFCNSYMEVFNPKAQNFRLQKKNPSWIIAEKRQDAVIKVPSGFGLESAYNYYFSHILNCPYDCRYCFLQGMYRSANYVWFINYDYFKQQILNTINKHRGHQCVFFSGYDADSMALDSITGFTREFVPWFAQHENALLELRTKSTAAKVLLQFRPTPNVVVAFSLTPQALSNQVEHQVPALSKRLLVMRQLADAGWKIGLRFDPILDADDFETQYSQLVEEIFSFLTADQLHSITVGPLRFPAKMFNKILKLYPHDSFLSGLQPLNQGKNYSYSNEREVEMMSYVLKLISSYVESKKIFSCVS